MDAYTKQFFQRLTQDTLTTWQLEDCPVDQNHGQIWAYIPSDDKPVKTIKNGNKNEITIEETCLIIVHGEKVLSEEKSLAANDGEYQKALVSYFEQFRGYHEFSRPIKVLMCDKSVRLIIGVVNTDLGESFLLDDERYPAYKINGIHVDEEEFGECYRIIKILK